MSETAPARLPRLSPSRAHMFDTLSPREPVLVRRATEPVPGWRSLRQSQIGQSGNGPVPVSPSTEMGNVQNSARGERGLMYWMKARAGISSGTRVRARTVGAMKDGRSWS